MTAESEKRTKHTRLTVAACPSCNRVSRVIWRCEWCGRDLASNNSTKGDYA